MNFAYLHGSPIYHSGADSTSAVSRATLQQQGENVLSLAKALGETDLSVSVDPEGAVFFTVAGSRVIRYSEGLALGVAIVVVMSPISIRTSGASRGRKPWLKQRGCTEEQACQRS